jgi:hypothetical protein
MLAGGDLECRTSQMNPHQIGYKKSTLSRKNGDATSVILILVIACVVLTILVLASPETIQLTPEQINQLPL